MNEKLEQIIREVESRQLNFNRVFISVEMKNNTGGVTKIRYRFSSIPECELIFVQMTAVLKLFPGADPNEIVTKTIPILYGGLTLQDYECLIDDAYLEFGAVKKRPICIDLLCTLVEIGFAIVLKGMKLADGRF